MKKLATILLMSILLINWYGYRIVAEYFENRVADEMQAELDNDHYSEADLVTIKVPLSLPYISNYQNYEKMEGNIQVNGVSYQYVKRRVFNDTLELKCIPNTAKTIIRNARDEFSKLANDFVNLSASKKTSNSHNHNFKFAIQDFTDEHSFDMHHTVRIPDGIAYHSASHATSSMHIQIIEQPPEA